MALRQKLILYSSVNTTSCKIPDTRIKLKWKKNVSGAREFFGLIKDDLYLISRNPKTDMEGWYQIAFPDKRNIKKKTQMT
jgi:hypothetical protein